MNDLVGGVKADCVCGCGLFGTPRKRPAGHIRGCDCAKCRGKRNRSKGLRKQTEARKALGVAPSHKFGDANEENWKDNLFQNEVKAGAQIKAAVTAWNRIEAQVQSNQTAIGSLRKPCRAILMPVLLSFTPPLQLTYGGHGDVRVGHGLKRRLMLHDLCAAHSGLSGFAGSMWSACQGSFGIAGCWQIQQTVALSRTALALVWYEPL